MSKQLFTLEIANNIRDDYYFNGLLQKEISIKYSVSIDTIYKILKNKKYIISEKDFQKYLNIKNTTKKCSKCGQRKNKDDFRSRKCKPCYKEDSLLSYHRNKDIITPYKPQKNNIIKYCRRDNCKQELLIGENWALSNCKTNNYICRNCESVNGIAKPQAKLQKHNIIKYCSMENCGAELILGQNWPEILKQYSHYRCSDCFKKKCNTYYKKIEKTEQEKINDAICRRLRNNLSKYIYAALKLHNSSKNDESCIIYLPYTVQELKQHIEKQFEPWMTWNNQGQYRLNSWNDNDQSTWKWQIDHIIPATNFHYISMKDEEFNKCWALENLRPLSAKQNLLDGVRRTRHKKAA